MLFRTSWFACEHNAMLWKVLNLAFTFSPQIAPKLLKTPTWRVKMAKGWEESLLKPQEHGRVVIIHLQFTQPDSFRADTEESVEKKEKKIANKSSAKDMNKRFWMIPCQRSSKGLGGNRSSILYSSLSKLRARKEKLRRVSDSAISVPS